MIVFSMYVASSTTADSGTKGKCLSVTIRNVVN